MKELQQSRREFLRMAGKGAVGAVALSAIPSIMKPALADGVEAPAYPWTYVQVDKDVVREHAYESFYSAGGCCAGVAAGILEVMANQYGYPYNQIPAAMFANGAGGYGASSLCGSLGGACAVIGLFCDPKDSRAIRDELYAWYKSTAFPIYQPKIQSITTVSESIQCADSVGKYMAATGYAMGDDGRKARCAGVTADVAAKTIELLNIHFGYEAAPAAVVEEPAVEGDEYIGVGKSEIGGDIKVKVTVKDGKILKIDVLEQNETAAIADPAFKKIREDVIATQSADVDIVSGATKTSQALIAAIKDALSQIK